MRGMVPIDGDVVDLLYYISILLQCFRLDVCLVGWYLGRCEVAFLHPRMKRGEK